MVNPAVLTMACRCGRTASAPCPELRDIPATAEQLTRLGWGWDERGRVRCPECVGADEPAAVPEQGRLF